MSNLPLPSHLPIKVSGIKGVISVIPITPLPFLLFDFARSRPKSIPSFKIQMPKLHLLLIWAYRFVICHSFGIMQGYNLIIGKVAP